MTGNYEVLWCIWLEKNNHIFIDDSMLLYFLRDTIMLIMLIFLWNFMLVIVSREFLLVTGRE